MSFRHRHGRLPGSDNGCPVGQGNDNGQPFNGGGRQISGEARSQSLEDVAVMAGQGRRFVTGDVHFKGILFRTSPA